MSKNIIIANWKMNKSFDDIEPWLDDFKKALVAKDAEIVLCAPAILLDYIDELLLAEELDIIQESGNDVDKLSDDELEKLTSNIRTLNIGGQDCAIEQDGAFTGDISAKMLRDAGCNYVIIGHSERRQYHFESNEVVSKKMLMALKNDLMPILCVGEPLDVRKNDDYFNFIKNQIHNSIISDVQVKDLVVAYEPIWSIGTGMVPSIEQISEVTDFIKSEISNNFSNIKNLRIIYGGSVNLDNSSKILSIKNISGLLVGGASLKSNIFASIVNNKANL